MIITIERGMRFLSIRLARSKGSPFEGFGGKATEQIAHDILHMDVDNPAAVLLAARVVALDRLLRGEYPGIPSSCSESVSCAALDVVRKHCSPGCVKDDIYIFLKDPAHYNHGGACDHLCSENPDPELRLRAEEIHRVAIGGGL